MEHRIGMMKEMIDLQTELDKRIDKNLIDGRNKFTKKVLAFAVEVAEMANESRSFKYWSKDQTARRERVKEEAADVFHFLISIGLDVEPDLASEADSGLDVAINFSLHTYYDDPTDLTLELMQDTILLTRKEPETLDFWLMLGKFFKVADFFDLTFEDLHSAYLQKNTINHERQEAGY